MDSGFTPIRTDTTSSNSKSAMDGTSLGGVGFRDRLDTIQCQSVNRAVHAIDQVGALQPFAEQTANGGIDLNHGIRFTNILPGTELIDMLLQMPGTHFVIRPAIAALQT